MAIWDVKPGDSGPVAFILNEADYRGDHAADVASTFFCDRHTTIGELVTFLEGRATEYNQVVSAMFVARYHKEE